MQKMKKINLVNIAFKISKVKIKAYIEINHLYAKIKFLYNL